MKLIDIYKKAIEIAIENDPRGRDIIFKDLERREKDYNDLSTEEKEFFDKESLQNPYSDSRILFGTEDDDIKSILVGIDIDVGEILLADNLKSKGRRIDLLLSHHPSGKAFANLYAVMQMQSDILNKFGVPINVAEGLMDGRIKEVERRLLPVNHTRAVDAARLIGIPFLCLHTAADNMVASYLQRLFDERKPYFLSDVLDILKNIPEYRMARIISVGPKIILGSKNRKAGKIFVDMTGGTSGAKEIFESLTNSGVSTIIAMHISEDHRKEAEKYHMNFIVAGHISSDTLGLNLLIDEILKYDSLEILECSGFKRFSRLNEH
ncbi:MAG: NGG1p interacting factor NIF3 [Nitrospirae bacterium RBG_13_39_12]|nr:MAG: NGG1p interacting factor NIF3 [Nitrospirae bacterium RBG_13_39_12]